MAQKLKNFKVRKVSLVPWGANNEEISFKKSATSNEILIFKSADYDNLHETSKIDLEGTTMVKLTKEDTPPKEETEEEKKKREEEAKAKAAAEGGGEAQKSASPTVKKEGETPAEEKKDEDEDEKKKTEEAQKSAVSKSIIAEIRKAVDEATAPLKAENAELKKALDGEQAIRETREFISKANKDFPNLGNPAEVGVLLMSIEKSNMPSPEKDKIYSIFKQSNVANNYLFKASGHSGPAPAKESAAAEINKRAQDMIQKSDGKMDIAIARTKVRASDPALAAKERDESRGVV